MTDQNIFYVYELIDPRTNTPFYVGKGVGNRTNQYHFKHPKVNDYTRVRLEEIALSGNKLEIRYVSESMSEPDAIVLERELINKYGRLVKDAGGTLTNIKSSGVVRNPQVTSGNKYTTIQIRREINDQIKAFCVKHGFVSAKVTQLLWERLISSSLTGSISL